MGVAQMLYSVSAGSVVGRTNKAPLVSYSQLLAPERGGAIPFNCRAHSLFPGDLSQTESDADLDSKGKII